MSRDAQVDAPGSPPYDEPRRAWDKKPACPNCGFMFNEVDNYCPNCGQPNTSHKRPVRYFIKEFFQELLNLDARSFATVRDLFLKPGLLTRNYNADLRVRYTPPLRFFVLASVLFFLTISWMTRSSVRQMDSQLQDALVENDSIFSNTNLTLFGDFWLDSEDIQVLSDLDVYTMETVDSVLTVRGKKTGWLNNRVVLGLTPLFTGRFSLEEYYGKLLQNFSYSLFFFMPVLALILKVLYLLRHQFYTEHLIFSIHFHTFAFLLLFGCLWIDYFQDYVSFTLLALVGIPVYLALAMKGVYGQGWIVTLFKSTVAFWSYFSVVTLGFVFLFFVSLI